MALGAVLLDLDRLPDITSATLLLPHSALGAESRKDHVAMSAGMRVSVVFAHIGCRRVLSESRRSNVLRW